MHSQAKFLIFAVVLLFMACAAEEQQQTENKPLPKFVFDTIDTRKYSAEKLNTDKLDGDWYLSGNENKKTLLEAVLKIRKKSESHVVELFSRKTSNSNWNSTLLNYNDSTSIEIPNEKGSSLILMQPPVWVFTQNGKTDSLFFASLQQVMFKSAQMQHNQLILLVKTNLWATDTFTTTQNTDAIMKKLTLVKPNDSIYLLMNSDAVNKTLKDIITVNLP